MLQKGFLVQGAVTKAKPTGFTDHNKKWLKPKAPVVRPEKPQEEYTDDSETEDGAVTSKETRIMCQVLLPVRK